MTEETISINAPHTGGILEAEKTYVALPMNFKNRGPIVFKGCRRNVTVDDHSNDDYAEDENGVANCWPFYWDDLEPGNGKYLAVGFNGNCGTGYRIYEMDEAGRYKLAEWLIGKARYTLVDGIKDSAVLDYALYGPDAKFLGETPKDILIRAGGLKVE